MNALTKAALAITPVKDVADRIKALDWERVSKDLEAQGHVMIEGLITPYTAGDYNGASAIQSGVRITLAAGMDIVGEQTASLVLGEGDHRRACASSPAVIELSSIGGRQTPNHE
jgi:hypothetical protein